MLGSDGLLAGQYHDLYKSDDYSVSRDDINYLKTGKMFEFCLSCGICASDAHVDTVNIARLGKELGVFFQIYDDYKDK